MEVVVGPQDGPSQKLMDELEVRYFCLPKLGVQWSCSDTWFVSSGNWNVTVQTCWDVMLQLGVESVWCSEGV